MQALSTHTSARLLAHSSLRRALSSKTPPPPPPPNYLGRIDLGSSQSSSSSSPHVGPFPLPNEPTSSFDRSAQIEAEARRWRDLGRAEKVGRASTNIGSFFVVSAGAALAGLVAYSFGSELWAENSPTRVFEDATERVKQSKELSLILQHPLSFHGQNSANRMRRNRRVSSSLSPDGQALLVRFWVEGVEPESSEPETWLGWAKRWIGPAIYEDSHNPGNYHPSPSPPAGGHLEASPVPAVHKQGWGEWVGGAVSGFVGSAVGGLVPKGLGGAKEGSRVMGMIPRKPRLGEYSTGEVTAELKKDPQTGHFVYTALYVDVPESHHPGHYRVHIPTDVVSEPTRALDRLRIWNRKTTA